MFRLIFFWLQVRPPLSLFTIKMANIWQIRGAPYGAQWRVPTNFIVYVFTLMLVLLSYNRFISRLGPTLEKQLMIEHCTNTGVAYQFHAFLTSESVNKKKCPDENIFQFISVNQSIYCCFDTGYYHLTRDGN